MIIKHITKTLNSEEEIEILKLFEADIEKISIQVFTKDDPLFLYLSLREIIRTRIFLSRITAQEPYKTHLIVTKNDHNQITGYILYHKHVENPNNITIISTSVYSKCRRLGIFKSMLDILKSQYSGILLTCCLENVPIFQKLDFVIDCAYQTQIGMNYNCKDEEGNVIGVEENFINNVDVVVEAYEDIKINNSNYQDYFSHLKNRNELEITKVKLFVKQHKKILNK